MWWGAGAGVGGGDRVGTRAGTGGGARVGTRAGVGVEARARTRAGAEGGARAGARAGGGARVGTKAGVGGRETLTRSYYQNRPLKCLTFLISDWPSVTQSCGLTTNLITAR